ncbi:hypothetical protein DSO57_1032157 [Entomophthora muscae]|uniref:Uncharacterized protein n=1 Tax=Entomophthora muscae TaxID=34485 RepID=A0ACC2TZ00_9FUNG|nr:hypothetical protein DSO57_1032157 [Entomophthora muscae]
MDQVPISQGIEPSDAIEPISRTPEEKRERLEACKKQERKLSKLKSVLERWERDFIKRAGRRPGKEDLADRPKMAERFQIYRKKKHQHFKDYLDEILILHPKILTLHPEILVQHPEILILHPELSIKPDSSKDKLPEKPPKYQLLKSPFHQKIQASTKLILKFQNLMTRV